MLIELCGPYLFFQLTSEYKAKSPFFLLVRIPLIPRKVLCCVIRPQQ